MISPIPLTTETQLADVLNNPKPRKNGVLLFKHSPRCIVSKMVLRELLAEWNLEEDEVEMYLIDVINSRSLSNMIAEQFSIRHESPQLLYIKENTCVGNASHNGVSIQLVDSWIHG